MTAENRKLHVLFVDDDRNVLGGLRAALRKQSAEWEMRFAESGTEALATLADWTADVVVSDMRMPGLDGAELLTKVRERSPSTARIALSGQAEESLSERAKQVAHAWVFKPCERQTLIDVISRFAFDRDTEKLPDPES